MAEWKCIEEQLSGFSCGFTLATLSPDIDAQMGWRQLSPRLPTLLPTPSVISYCGGLQSYHCRLSTLLMLLKSTQIPQKCIRFVEYWREAAACFLPDGSVPLSEIGEKVLSAYSSESISFLNSSYLAFVLEKSEVQKSISHYRLSMLTIEAVALDQPEAITAFEAALTKQPGLWQHSASFLQVILQLSGLQTLHTAALLQPSFGLHPNSYLACISSLLTAHFTSAFSVLLCDALQSHLTPTEQPSTWLPTHLPLLSLLRPYIDQDDKDIYSLIAVSMLRVILDHVTVYMHTFKPIDNCALIGLDEATAGLPDCLLYCVKSLKALGGYSYPQLRKLIKYREACSWLQGWKWPEGREFEGGLKPPNMEMYVKLEHCLEGNGDFAEIAEELRSESGQVTFLLRVMEETYCKFRHSVEVNPKVTHMLNFHREQISTLLGGQLCGLIQLFLSNFPAYSLLHMDSSTSDSRFHLNVQLLYLLITVLCYRACPSPCTSIFFADSTSLSTLFLYGVASHPLYEYLSSVQRDFDQFSSEEWRTEHRGRFAKGSAYRCSDSCDFVYFVGNCAGVMSSGQCPFCGERIGGRNYTLADRAGHQNLTDSEAMAFISSALDKHRISQPAGYLPFGLVSTSHVRHLDPVAHRIMHWCLHGSLYALLAVEVLSDWEVRQTLGVQGCAEAWLRARIEEDWREMEHSLAVADHYYVISAAISMLPALIREHCYLPTTALLRGQFEQAFNSRLVPLVQQPLRAVCCYKEGISAARGGFSPHLEEFPSADMRNYPLHKLFRMRGKRDRQSLEAFLKQGGIISPIVAYYWSKKSAFDQLGTLEPLLALTNYLLSTYSFTLTRSEAFSLPIHKLLACSPQLASLYGSFITAWTLQPPTDLHYLCTPLPCTRYDDQCVLGEFLLDDQELSGGLSLAAAIMQLGELQNCLIQAFDETYGSCPLRETKPIQTLSSADILHCTLDPERAVNSPEYGSGAEVAYDWSALEKQVRSAMEQAVWVDTKQLKMMVYLGEFLSPVSEHSAALIEVRLKVPQQPLSPELSQLLGKREKQELRRLLGLLEQAFLTLLARDCCATAPISTLLEQDCAYPVLTSTPVKCIVALYERLEDLAFPSLRPSFPLTSSPHIPAIAKVIVTNRQLYEGLGEIKTAIRRFLLRCGGSRGVDEAKAASEVIGRGDYWSESVEESRVDAVSSLFKKVAVGELRQLYGAIEEAEKTKKQKKRGGFAAG